MKKTVLYSFFLLLATGFLQTVQGQPGTPDGNYPETYLIVTDRGHYISGESIYFRAFTLPSVSALSAGSDGGAGVLWSRILYVELISPDGSSLARSKVLLDLTGAEGRIRIPTGIASGTYYLKAYSRWMRNCGPTAFSYTSLCIYDPFLETVLPVDTARNPMDDRQFIWNEKKSLADEHLDAQLDLTLAGRREQVELELGWDFPSAPVDLSVSVARTGLHSGQRNYLSGCRILPGSGSHFIPETKGISLTGKTVKASDGTPVPYATIYISVLGDEHEFFSNYSDSSGAFYFSFPDYTGEQELFVSGYSEEHGDLELKIDRDFCFEEISLPSPPLEWSDSLGRTLSAMSVNAQIDRQYRAEEVVQENDSTADRGLFYGQPSATILFADFIRLPTLEEYFTEIIPQVSLRKQKGSYRFTVNGPHPDLQVYRPLVMIDGVAIFDMEALLHVNPRLIDRVEIVTAPYIRGNVTYGGIVSLITRNGDLGYIDLPSSGLLVNYQMLDVSLPDPLIREEADPRIPDVRNTLFWLPEIILKTEETRRIAFRTADEQGSYQVMIRGLDPSGLPFTRVLDFVVE